MKGTVQAYLIRRESLHPPEFPRKKTMNDKMVIGYRVGETQERSLGR